MNALVVGIGNRSRGDDAVGPEVAARVAQLGIPDVEVVVHDEPLALVQHFGTHDDVVVVDATAPHGDPGSMRVLQVGSAPLRRDMQTFGSSHGFGVVEAVELARALGRLPRRLTLIGVEGLTFGAGAPLSAQIADHVDGAVQAVVGALPATKRYAGLARCDLDPVADLVLEDPELLEVGQGLQGRLLVEALDGEPDVDHDVLTDLDVGDVVEADALVDPAEVDLGHQGVVPLLD